LTLVKGVTLSLNYLREKKTGPSGEPNQGPDTGLMEPLASGRWSVKLEFVNACIAGYTSSTETTYPVRARPDLTYNGVALDIYAAKVAAGFGTLGLWLWNGGVWTQISAGNPD
jgi:hypothetical protein